jgi:DNA-binding transcriptional ArsR family regulator
MLLATPKSTTQLVALTGQRLGSVGRHLQILRDAGLLERRRVGRSVLYRRSPAGDLLVRIQDGAVLPSAGGRGTRSPGPGGPGRFWAAPGATR